MFDIGACVIDLQYPVLGYANHPQLGHELSVRHVFSQAMQICGALGWRISLCAATLSFDNITPSIC